MKNIFCLIVTTITLSFSVSCKKFTDVPAPTNLVVSDLAFSDDRSATSTVVGIYSDMMQTYRAISNSTSLYAGLSADELTSSAVNNIPFLNNNLQPTLSTINTYWQQMYSYIYDANAVLDGLKNSTGVSPAVKNQLTGEALFVRAFVHFYLVNLFGDVPLITTSDYRINATLPRTPSTDIYAQIILDLKNAQNILQAAYPTTERARPNKWTATALLARVYLYVKDYVNAEIQSNAVVTSGSYSQAALSTVFLKSSSETIWQLMPVSTFLYTFDGATFIPSATATTIPNTYLNPLLVASFEAGDQRKTNWVGSKIISGTTYYYPFKYKAGATSTSLTEYYIVFRLSEQYLIRAEARAQQGTNLSGAISDLNVIRNRAGLSNYTGASNQVSVLNSLMHERQIELFTEWGHRWCDLKRTNLADVVLKPIKGSTWESTDTLYPIPSAQIGANIFLTQNAGY